MKRSLKLLGMFGVACFGLSGVGTAIYSLAHVSDAKQIFIGIGTLAAGLFLIFLFIRSMKKAWMEWMEETNEASYYRALRSKIDAVTKNALFSSSAVDHDLNEEEQLITHFRSDYQHFFAEQGAHVHENTPLQNSATQILWNILSLQKRRLDRLGLTMSLQATRMRYLNDADSVTGSMLFDGKYEVSEVYEMIRADRSFNQGEKKIARFKTREAARYHLQNVRKHGANQIICPNCGTLSTRENLIDGCDYCHTKFLIEDLGMRISDFGLFSDYDIEAKKYKESRDRLMLRTGLISYPFILALVIMQTLPQVFASPSFGDHGVMFEAGAFVFFVVFRAVFLTALIIGAVLLIFSPILTTKASIIRYRKSDLKKMQETEQKNEQMQSQIREHDPLFSLGEFFANIQNKLAVFHYAENTRQMEAFTDSLEILPSLLKKYENIVHFDVKQMALEHEERNKQFQKAVVTAQLVLLEQKGSRIVKKNETVHLQLIRNASCKTNAVCEPVVMTCKHCGAPHHILDGCTCNYCGHKRVLSDYDWMITEYDIVG